MSLKILVKNATNLPNLESMGTSDPYVTVAFQGKKEKTEVKKSTLDPVWDAEIQFTLSKPPHKEETIEIEVKDYERISWNKLMGKTTIPVRNLGQGKSSTKMDLEQTLMDGNDQPTAAKLNMSVNYEPLQDNKMATSPGSTGAADVQSGSITYVDETDGKGGGGMPHLVGGNSKVAGLSSLSNVKTKFQLRVRVVEGRQLLGENLQPVCRVGFKQKIHQTKVQRSCSPWFDQLFFFHEEELPEVLLASFLDFTVSNSKMLRAESVIGGFKCELGQIYNSQDHSVINRWLVLTHPDEPTPTVQGYLKVSVSVLGPGDVCPDMSPSVNDEDDIESNLLWSAGVHLQPATFNLSVYLAQNLPRMDSGAMQSLKEAFGFGKASKELVDPYVVASFAGREVQTKILYCNDNPVFKQKIHLGFLFPSMCNTLRITLMDWDRVGEDDVIGTAVIPIDEISAPGDNGFLPTFGPSFVNVYGARREFELWEGKDVDKMNVGTTEGCSYRGRVLVSLGTEVGSYPSNPTSEIVEETFNNVRRYRGTQNFVVVAHLTHAFLLKEANKPLEIEVSMGNFGNKLEDSLLPSPSTTHPSNPVFDGCKYYYLPWGDSVPLITIECEWEDISHRLLASNALLHIAQELECDVIRIQNLIKAKTVSTPMILVQIREVLTKLREACRRPLPEWDATRYVETSLDTYLRKYRQQELQSLCKSTETFMRKEPPEVVEELMVILKKLKNLAQEPQSSMPDIFLWLLSGTERLAYARIPAQSVLHSSNSNWAGINAGKFQSFLLKYPGKSRDSIGGVVRASLWLGRADDLPSWWEVRGDLQLTVYAETYENQVVSTPGSGKWTNKGALMRRPPFSDADGLMNLPKEQFKPAIGWKFQGDWVIDPDPSIKFSLDAGHTIYCEEVFQQQARVPGGTWLDIPQATWADTRGDPERPRDDVTCPQGWQWRDAWATDLQRAVDSEGWEYTVQKGITGWSPQEKLYHILRRRRWVRERHRVMQAKGEEKSKDGWEYSTLFSKRYHARERAIDIVRRRRWRRKLVPVDQGMPETPRIMVSSEDDKEQHILNICPRQYVMSSEFHQYQLRAHIYQARDLASGDKSGLSDPYALVSFCGLTQQTEKQSNTLSPTWDQTLIFETKIIGPLLPPNGNCRPPAVIIELFDWDARGDPDYLGRLTCDVTACNPSDGYKPPKLSWYQIEKGTNIEGELLASFELLLMTSEAMPNPPPTKGDLFKVPFGVRPILQKTRIEVLCWGVRNMATFDLQSVTRPCIEFECGGNRIASSVMKNIRQNPNFENPHLIFDVELPKEELYMPPLSIRVKDHRSFGSRPLVATATLTDLHHYNVEPLKARKTSAIAQAISIMNKFSHQKKLTINKIDEEKSSLASLTPSQPDKPKALRVDQTLDWWSKYYASVNDEERSGSYLSKGYEKLEVVKGNLEDDPRFNCFRDLIDTISLYRGRLEQSTVVGEFKGTFRIYSLPSSGEEPPKVLEGFPSPAPQEIVARVYVVSARDLAPKDSGSSSDPYVVVSLGKCTQRDDQVKTGTLNPTFGKIFEVKGAIPLVKDLKVQVWDRDSLSSDDLIGETVIDLENRFLSRYRASLGLPKQYHLSGPNAWRDYKLPSEILEEVAKVRHMDGPHWDLNIGPSLELDGTTYALNEYEPEGTILPPSVGEPAERLALHVLNGCFVLVNEHVEERPLYNSERPGLSQGNITIWIDIFPSSVTLPPPVDITPRKPSKYVLRVCIYNVHDFPLDETSITGEQMSDVYVKGWFGGTSDVQKTDVHYRCMGGEANFNWRFIFPFEYLEAEQMMILKRKSSFFSLDETEERRSPQLILQLWDDDLILKDDFLGEMTLNLNCMPKPNKSLDGSTTLSNLQRKLSTVTGLQKRPSESLQMEPLKVNLFEAKRVYGFFPFVRIGENGTPEPAGQLEAEFEVVPEDEAAKRPAGQGRDSPNANPVLAEPNRPATSFLWITSPWKSFKFVVWKRFKWNFITFILLFLLLLFLLLFLYALPGATMDYIVGVD